MKRTQPRADNDGPKKQEDALFVVGLGASAGGVEALKAFFAGLSGTEGMAFVVVLHLAPDKESLLAEVLQSDLPLPVTQVTEAVAIEPGHVYVIPPNKNLVAAGTQLLLEDIQEERRLRRPIDHFFRTLAEAYGDHAIGIVLSGTGANGTVGVRRIREMDGFVLAQDPDDAQFDEMPRSAISSGVVDFIGTAGALAAEVVAYANRRRHLRLPDSTEALEDDSVRALQHVLAVLRARTGHDFAHYKRATVLRRLDRRLHVTGSDSLEAYLHHIQEDPTEAGALLADLLISVTHFFRDPEAFAVLERDGIPGLFVGKEATDEVRAWVVGCATGEEAYSLAMLLLEHAATIPEAPRIQVFATDLSEAAVQKARAGTYPESIEADVSAQRLRRFFVHENGHYRASEPLREAVLFTPHSPLKDPPFSRLDLVSCRNLLIYLQREIQQQMFALFHYTLRPGGLLFLGSSESTEGGVRLFDVVAKDARLFRRLDVDGPPPQLPQGAHVVAAKPGHGLKQPHLPPPDHAADEHERLHRTLRQEAAPPSVLINEVGDIVHISDTASPFLRVAGGSPTRNLVKLLRPELRASVQLALFQARREEQPVTAGPAEFSLDGRDRRVDIHARQVPGGFSHLLFALRPPRDANDPFTAVEADAALQAELQETRQQLQVSVEEFETIREELRAENEELHSINEELRSTTEELETAKEEAQSMAEELRTVNDELKEKVDETARSKADLENLIASTEIATLFLDRHLKIKRFTPRARDHFHVLASDVGRPLADLAQKFGGVLLVEDAEAVLERLDVQQREIRSSEGRWFLVHARPYRTAEDRIDGVVITFVDISERVANENAIRAAAERFRALVEASAQIVWQADIKGHILGDSPSWRVFTGQAPGEAKEGGWMGAVHPDDLAGAVEGWRLSVQAQEDFDAEVRLHHAASESWRRMHVRAVPLRDEKSRLYGYVGMNTDVHDQREAERDLRASVANAAYRVSLTDALRPLSDPFDIQGAAARVLGEHLGASRVHYAEMEDDDEHCVVVQDYARGVPEGTGRYRVADFAALFDIVRAGRTFVSPDIQADGRLSASTRAAFAELPVEAIVVAPLVKEGRLIALFAAHHNAVHEWADDELRLIEETALRTWASVERAHTERSLRESEERFRQTAETVPDVLFTATSEGVVDYVSGQFEALTGSPISDALGTVLWPDLIHPDDRERTRAAWARAREGQEAFEIRHQVLTRNGTCNVLVRARPVSNADGTSPRWYGTVTDVEALTALAAQTRALASRLATAEHEERERVALILHDDLQQQLYGLGMTLQILRTPSSDEEARILRDQADEILESATKLTRSLAVDLSPPVLASLNVNDLLVSLARLENKRYRLEIEIDVEGGLEIQLYETRVLLYNALRELLFNVAKHANTRIVRMRAWEDGDCVVVRVEDDGVGFDAEAFERAPNARDSFGIPHLRERIELLGGHLKIESAPGEGTRVTITLPAAALDADCEVEAPDDAT